MSQQWMPPWIKRQWRERLLMVQCGICAGCGRRFTKISQRGPHSPLGLTLDHVVPRASGGSHDITNLLLKHRICNQRRASAPANGCDLIWQMAVSARLASAGIAA